MENKRYRDWLLPLVFLAGYLAGWASVAVDRQMLITEQRQLKEEVERVRIELRITSMVDEYNEDYSEQVEWNKGAIKPIEEGGGMLEQSRTSGEDLIVFGPYKKSELYVTSDDYKVNFDTTVIFQDIEFGVHSILFYDDADEIIGALTWDEGVFVFKGRAKESAHQFFEHFLKPCVDSYIAKELEKEWGKR